MTASPLLTKAQKIVLVTCILILLPCIWYVHKSATTEVSVEQIAQAIKQVESKEAPRLGKDPSYDQIYESPYIQSIRPALNSYIDGTHTNIEDNAIKAEKIDPMQCGLESLTHDLYKGKFVVIKAEDDDYGGIQANIVFINNPNKNYWLWMYKYSTGEYVMRAFCEDVTKEEYKPMFKAIIEGMLGENREYYAL